MDAAFKLTRQAMMRLTLLLLVGQIATAAVKCPAPPCRMAHFVSMQVHHSTCRLTSEGLI